MSAEDKSSLGECVAEKLPDITNVPIITPDRLLGELKAAKAEIVRLQRQLQKFQKDHDKQVSAIQFLLQQKTASGGGMLANTVSYDDSEEAPTSADSNRGEGTLKSEELASTTDDEIVCKQSAAQSSVIMHPIGFLKSCFVRLNGTPRQGDICRSARARLQLENVSDAAMALDGLAAFSHVWVLYHFHLNKSAMVKPKVAPPRLGGARVGVFSTRAPYRHNPIGLSLARVEAVEGDTIELSGLDIVDGTPVLDIKPYLPTFDGPTTDVRVPSWLLATQDTSLEIDVVIPDEVLDTLRGLAGHLKMFKDVMEAAECIKEVLQCDPRSVYRKTKCAQELYPLCLDALHILTQFDGRTATVVSVQLLSDTAFAEAPLNVNNLPPDETNDGIR